MLLSNALLLNFEMVFVQLGDGFTDPCGFLSTYDILWCQRRGNFNSKSEESQDSCESQHLQDVFSQNKSVHQHSEWTVLQDFNSKVTFN